MRGAGRAALWDTRPLLPGLFLVTLTSAELRSALASPCSSGGLCEFITVEPSPSMLPL